MNSIWLSLLWKEWCEFRWKLAALAGILVSIPILFVVVPSWTHRDRIEGLYVVPVATLMFYVPMASFFVGMTVAGGENARRTMRFLQALPTSYWKCALVKICMAIGTVALPLLLVTTAYWALAALLDSGGDIRAQIISESRIWGTPWGINNWHAGVLASALLGTTSLVIWMAAAGVNRSDELSAGAAGFLVIASVWFVPSMASAALNEWGYSWFADRLDPYKVALPGGPALNDAGLVNGRFSPWMLIVALLSYLAVLNWYLKRFGKAVTTNNYRKGVQISDLLRFRTGRAPFASEVLATAWKQVRETGPLALVATVIVLLIVAATAYVERRTIVADTLSQFLATATIAIGVLIAFVAGIGVHYEDYARGVENFWRSRPVNLHFWFVVKSLVALAVLVGSFGSLLLIAWWLSDWRYVGWASMKMIAMVFVMIFTTGLAAYSFIRQPLYAAIMAILAMSLVPTLAAYLSEYWLVTKHSQGEWTMILGIILTAFSTLLAWQAVVRDWGWKQHR